EARQLDDVARVDAQLEERVDDALGDGVMAAAGAQRGHAAAIGRHLEPDTVLLLAGVRRRGCGFCAHSLIPRRTPPPWRVRAWPGRPAPSSSLPARGCRRSTSARRSA